MLETRLNGNKGERKFTLIGFPDRCPICLETGTQNNKKLFEAKGDTLYIIFTCPSIKCNSVYFSLYKKDPIKSFNNNNSILPTMVGGVFNFSHTWGENVSILMDIYHSEELKKISPRFLETLKKAENMEIRVDPSDSRMIYRKALEILIKDYLLLYYIDDPSLCDNIKKENLQISIKRFDNIKIKDAAEKAAWLGNDGSHYNEKHEDFNVNDCKKLILITAKFIELELMLKHYQENLNKK